MKQLWVIVVLSAGSLLLAGGPTTQPGEDQAVKARSHVPRQQVLQVFAVVRTQTKWNIDGDMVWGYYFVDRGSDRLKLLQRELEQQGYRYVELHENLKRGNLKRGRT